MGTDNHSGKEQQQRKQQQLTQATVSVVKHKVSPQCYRGIVVHAARAISYIAQNNGFHATETLKNVGDWACIHQQTFWELQGNRFKTVRTNSMNALVNFKVVILRQKGNGLSDLRVVQNL